MDPKACWQRMAEAANAAEDLRRWQGGGGDTSALPEGMGARLRDFARVCRALAAEVPEVA